MGIVFRQSIKTTLVTLTGAMLGALIVYLNSHLLSQDQYALVTIIITSAAVAQMVVMMGTANLVSIYTQRYKYEDERRKGLLSIGIGTTAIGSLLLFLTLLVFKNQIIGWYKPEDQPMLQRYYILAPALIFIMAMTTVFDQYLVSHVKIAVSAFSREVVLRLVNIALLCIFFLGYIPFNQYILCIVLMYLIPLIIIVYVSTKTKGFGFTTKLSVFTKAEYRDMAHFSLFHLLTGASLVILNFLDTLLVGPLDPNGIESTATYTVAVFISSVLFMPYRAMATSSLPILNQAYIDRDLPTVRDLFSRAGVNIFIAAMGMFVLIALNMDNAIAILPAEYASVKYLVLILMIGKVADMATGLNNELISISKHYKFNFVVAIILLAMVFVLDRIFIPQYGTLGAAWVASGSLIVFNIIKMTFLYKKMKLHPFTKKTWLVLVAAGVGAGVGYIIPFIINPFVDTVIRSIVILLTYCLMLIWLQPSKDLKVFLQDIKKNKRLF